MKIKRGKIKMTDEEYYDSRGVLGEISNEDIDLSLWWKQILFCHASFK